MTGEIVEALRNGMFRIQLDNGHETLGYTAGKMRRFRIRMNPGDRVRIELSAYDLARGRIVYRLRPGAERPEKTPPMDTDPPAALERPASITRLAAAAATELGAVLAAGLEPS